MFFAKISDAKMKESRMGNLYKLLKKEDKNARSCKTGTVQADAETVQSGIETPRAGNRKIEALEVMVHR